MSKTMEFLDFVEIFRVAVRPNVKRVLDCPERVVTA